MKIEGEKNMIPGSQDAKKYFWCRFEKTHLHECYNPQTLCVNIFSFNKLLN